MAEFMEATARSQKCELPAGYGYSMDLPLGVGFYKDEKTGCCLLEKPVCIPSGTPLIQGYIVLYAYCSKEGVESLLQGQMPPMLPATQKSPKEFDSLAAIADNFGQQNPAQKTEASKYCVAFRVPAELATQADTPGRNLWIIRFDQDVISPFLQLVKEGDAAKVAEGLSSGISGGVVDEEGVSALMMAANAGSLETCKALLGKDADVNLAEPKNGRTALMFAAQGGHSNIAKLLVDSGADVSKVDSEGSTALMWAAVANKAQTAEYLAACGSKDQCNKEGLSAAAVAEKMGHKDVVAVLK